MKFSILALAAVLSLVSAQNLGGEPSCAIPCLQTAISVAGCAPSDVSCQCGTGQAAIVSAGLTCLITNCNATELNIAESVGLGLCSQYSASLLAATTTSSLTAAASTSPLGPASTTSTSTNTTSVTVVTTSVPASNFTAATSAPAPVSSSGAAPGLVAGIGGAVGLLALVAAL